MNEDFRFEFYDDHLVLEGRDGWREATCPICDKPIQWCLDMFSFTTSFPHMLAHARCVWTAGAFRNEIAKKGNV